MTDKWSDGFHRSRRTPALFLTAKPYEQSVRAWLSEQRVPSFYSGGLYESSFMAWATLDAGVTSTQRYGLTGMPTGIRIIGWQTLRVLLSALDLAPPRGVFLGEPAVPVLAQLQEALRSATTEDPQACERAELLLNCCDVHSYQAVVRHLIGDCGLQRNRRPEDVAKGIWGDFHFTQGAADLLNGKVEPPIAEQLARRFEFRYDESTPEGKKANNVLDIIGYDAFVAHKVLRAARIDLSVLEEWVAKGFPIWAAVDSIDAGADLATAESWVSLGVSHLALAGAIKSGVSQLRVSQYVDSGVAAVLSLKLAERSEPIGEIRSRIAGGERPDDVARSLVF